MNDKKNIIKTLCRNKIIKLDIGCGPSKKDIDYIGIDMLDYESVDIVGDIYEVLSKFPDFIVDEIYTKHFLEHLDDIPTILNEIARVLKKDAICNIIVPHFSNPYYYSDCTHKSFFGLYTLNYFSKDEVNMRRKVPVYQREMNFKIEKIELIFQTTPKFNGRSLIKKFIQKIVNFNIYTLELYEEMFCYIFPCYEIRYKLIKI
jgi:ubiquinone/menaquinone biosynthesis C-methylase UbiE